MKTLIVIFAVITSVTIGFSQNDSILPNYYGNYSLIEVTIAPNLEWQYDDVTIEFFDNNEDDTIEVGSIPIAKIYFDGYKAFVLGTNLSSALHIYQDSAVVLYDFSLNVGDTAYYEDNSGTGGQDIPVTVTQVTYETIEGELRKKMILSNQDKWLQGVGSLIHPLWPVMSHFEIGYIFCSANLIYTSQGNFHDFEHYEQDCSWYFEIGLSELENPAKTVVKTFDLLGRETISQPNMILINLYSDGSTEKVFRIE